MSTNDDINALLGINPAEILQQSRQVKHELKVISEDELGKKVISETNDIMAMNWDNGNLLLMSSGNFDGVDFNDLANNIVI